MLRRERRLVWRLSKGKEKKKKVQDIFGDRTKNENEKEKKTRPQEKGGNTRFLDLGLTIPSVQDDTCTNSHAAAQRVSGN